MADDRVPNLLRDARERLGKTQGQVAEEVGVTQATVSNWESGEATPRPSKWSRISEVYGVSFKRLAEHCGAIAS
jgi:transcriptional regulator with XRE-family HTH domain